MHPNNLNTEKHDQPLSERRHFFAKIISFLFVSHLGLGALRTLGQTRSASTLDTRMPSKGLFSIKKLITSPQKNRIDQRVEELDNDFKAVVTKMQKTITDSEFAYLQQNISTKSAYLSLNKENSELTIHAPAEPPFSIRLSKIESQLTLDNASHTSGQHLFAPNRVENLLNQAADLLDRGIKDRYEWDDKAVKFLDLYLDLEKFVKNDELLERQIAAGWYKQDYMKSLSDLEVQKITQEKAVLAESQLTKLIDSRYHPDTISQQQHNLMRMNTSYTFTGFVSDNPGERPFQHAVPYGAGSEEKGAIQDVVNMGSLEANQFNLSVQKELDLIQLRSIESSSKVATRLKKYFLDKLQWEQKNMQFKIEQDQITRKMAAYRLNAFVERDGILNYSKRLAPLQTRFNNDFKEAYLRLQAAAYGIAPIFGFNEPLPVYDSTNPQFFDDCVVWNRKAINHIVRIGQRQHSFCLPVSVRELYSSEALYEQACHSGTWKVQIPLAMLEEKFLVRLTGVSLSLVGLDTSYTEPYNLEGCFSAIVQPPSTGRYKQYDGSFTELDLKDYLTPAAITFGKVYSTHHPIQTEVAGATTHINISPVGEWTIRLRPQSRPFGYVKKRNNRYKKIMSSHHVVSSSLQADSSLQPGTQQQEQPQDEILFTPHDFLDIQLNIFGLCAY